MEYRNKKIELTEVESKLKRLLVDVAKYIDGNPAKETESSVSLPEELANAKVELRFTGGWVRDKLLGVESHDIDVAINKMTGYQFGLRLKEYLEIRGNPEKYGLEGVAKDDKQSGEAGKTSKSKTVGGLHKIEANPEKSKHLETVTTKIFGLDIDLVNLRKETYTEESRNPQMEFGTPEEDALRRDATVNAMFYNLTTSEVEDLTKQGFDDMEKKIIRTPLEPYQTFKDDPLRVLRLIRFASRLDYIIDPEVEKFMDNEEIKDALRLKISRERVGVELEKMLKGPNPLMALKLIDRLHLYNTIFTDPTTTNDFQPELETWHIAYETLSSLLHPETSSEKDISNLVLRDAEERYIAWNLSALVPWADAPTREPKKAGGKTPLPYATDVAREGFKATNKLSDVVTASVRNLEDISNMLQKHIISQSKYSKESEKLGRDTLGMAIRRWGASWRSQVLFCLLHKRYTTEASNLVDLFAAFLNHISSLNLLEAHTFKPLLDGKTLAKALNTTPGPWMKDALEVVMAWQLRHPGNTDPQAAIDEVRNAQNRQKEDIDGGELISALIDHFLRLTIPPLFPKGPHHPSITAAGRKKISPSSSSRDYESFEDQGSKPWKYAQKNTLNLLRWVLKSIDAKQVEEKWPLLIPPILTIMDDHDIPTKAFGCEFISLLLERTPSALLVRTGLGDVFEDALFPCLSYLPTLTPTDQSIQILNAAYPALLTLANVRYPLNHTPSTKLPISQTETYKKRTKLLDKLIRGGILSGFHFCAENVHIATCLLSHLSPILTALGIDSVKHLKTLLPLLSGILCDPFGPASPDLMGKTIKALQGVILNAWPRMEVHRGDVLKGLTGLWINLQEDVVEKDGEGVEEVRRTARETVEMLVTAVGKGVDWKAEFGMLIEADERLAGLFEGIDYVGA